MCCQKEKLETGHLKLLWVSLMLTFIFISCEKKKPVLPDPELKITTIISGLSGIGGIETDEKGNLWVVAGTEKDRKVIVISQNGRMKDAIIHLPPCENIIWPESGSVLNGAIHLLRQDEMMYILCGDLLLRADISDFSPGDDPVDAAFIPAEKIDLNLTRFSADADSNVLRPYHLTSGPDGDLYIVDAAANSVIHRRGINDYSILAYLPSRFNPHPQNFLPKKIPPGIIPVPEVQFRGSPVIQAMPTSISYDGKDFLVTAFSGYPFLAGAATIYKVSVEGGVTVYGKDFSLLAGMAVGKKDDHVVLQFASSYDPSSGFTARTGGLLRICGSEVTWLAKGLDQPVCVRQTGENTWYVSSPGEGTVLKISYE